MSWLDEAQELIKNRPVSQTPGDSDAALFDALRKEYVNASKIEIERAIGYAYDKCGVKDLANKEFQKFIRQKLEE